MINQNCKKLKNISLVLIIVVLTIFASACSNKQEQLDKKANEFQEKQKDNQTLVKTSQYMFGTIKHIDKNTRTVGFDDLELITADKKERMKEIGITDKDFSNYYIYNVSKEIKNYKIKDNASIIIFRKENLDKISTDINGLYDQFKSGYENNYDIKIEGDYIVEIVQHLLEP